MLLIRFFNSKAAINSNSISNTLRADFFVEKVAKTIFIKHNFCVTVFYCLQRTFLTWVETFRVWYSSRFFHCA